MPVCQAIQHAHQKGIIHRDIKPSNVMVTLYDGKPVPKVIDFGVAKATEQKLTERTLFTQYGTMVGTLEYMSPEQAEMSALGVDTRSDIYSLGVLLVRAADGQHAADPQADEGSSVCRDSPHDQGGGAAQAEHAAERFGRGAGVDLGQSPHGAGQADEAGPRRAGLDRDEDAWRRTATAATRRPTASPLDVQRYLADEPVLACPPSAGYRLAEVRPAEQGRPGGGRAGAVLPGAARQRRRLGGARPGGARGGSGPAAGGSGRRRWPGRSSRSWPRWTGWRGSRSGPRPWRRRGGPRRPWPAARPTPRPHERVRQRLKDLEFIDRLEQIRMQRDGLSEGRSQNADQDYARAFRDYGVDVEELAVEASIERLKARPALAIPLAAALDDWVSVRRRSSKGDDAGWKRLVAVARGIDPEPLRDRLRSTPWPTPPRRRRTSCAGWPSRSTSGRTTRRRSIRLARTLQGRSPRHPDSAGRPARLPGRFISELNSSWAVTLESTAQDRTSNGAIRFYTVAVALPSVCRRCTFTATSACSYVNSGDLDEAIAVYRQAIDARPEDAGHYWRRIGDILRDQKKPAEAADAYRKAIDAYRQAFEAMPERVPLTSSPSATSCAQGKPDEAIAATARPSKPGRKSPITTGTPSATPCAPRGSRTRPSPPTARPSKPSQALKPGRKPLTLLARHPCAPSATP